MSINNQEAIAQQMKQGMRHLVSGVAVVAAKDPRGERYAMTVSSITSLTASPPSLLICIHEVAQTHAVLRQVDSFSANILTANQQAVSHACASEPQMSQRFTVGNWREHGEYKSPYLSDALSVFFCRISQRIDYGTHMIVIGDIQAVEVAAQDHPPLVYCRGDYHQLA